MRMIYLQDIHDNPLMPTERAGWVRRMLQAQQASVVERQPFVVKLAQAVDIQTQPLILGIDPGYTIGIAVVTPDGLPVFLAELSTRSKEIPGLMKDRAASRNQRRHHKRQKRQRRALAAGTAFTEEFRDFPVPGCDKDGDPHGALRCKTIKPKLSRFSNRGRDEKWLTPTVRHLLDSHCKFISLVMSFLPITEIVIEYASFDDQKMKNPDIQGEEYQQGPLLGFENVKQYVLERDRHLCQLCRKKSQKRLIVHHVVPSEDNGADSQDNLVTLCHECHSLVHTSSLINQKLLTKFEGVKKKSPASTILNILSPGLFRWLQFQDIPVKKTFGYVTKFHRKRFHLEKTHAVDAYIVALSRRCKDLVTLPGISAVPVLLYQQFRRHNRQLITRVEDRKYYLDGKQVAKNRGPGRSGQKEPSLDDFRETHKEADISKLIVGKRGKGKKAKSSKFHELLPGDKVLHEGIVKTVKGTSGKGKRVGFAGEKKYVSRKTVEKLRDNSGIVVCGVQSRV